MIMRRTDLQDEARVVPWVVPHYQTDQHSSPHYPSTFKRRLTHDPASIAKNFTQASTQRCRHEAIGFVTLPKVCLGNHNQAIQGDEEC